MVLLLVIFATLAIYFCFIAARTFYLDIVGPWDNSPPGPLLGVPLASWSIFDLRESLQQILKSPLLAFHSLVLKYGPVVRVSLGGQTTILLGSLEAIKEFSTLEETTSRPFNKTLLDLYSDGKPLGFGIGIGGPRWKEQRRFAARALKDLSEGQSGMEEKIQKEVQLTINHIKDLLQQRRTSKTKIEAGEAGEAEGVVLTSADRFFEVPNLNVIWGLVAALRYDFSDPRPQKQFNYLRAFLHEKAAGPLTVVPWLKYVPTFSSIYNNIIASMTKFRQALSEVIADQKRSYEATHPRGYIDLFLKAQEDGQGNYFTNEDLLIGCQDLFIAGSETTSASLAAAILYMVLYPDVQIKVQAEIDQHVGKDRYVTFKDRSSLPFTDATIMEVRRLFTPFPVTPPRIATRDLNIQGYKIPKGIPVQMMLFSVLRDKQLWTDPEQFKPSRFLDDSGRISVPEAFIPFSYGRRKCLGENLGTMSNFIFFSNLLQTFNFRVENETVPPSLSPVGGLTYGPEAFNVRISLRS